MKKQFLSGLMAAGLVVLLGLTMLPIQIAAAKPIQPTAGEAVSKNLVKSFNAQDLTACLALMTDDAVVTVHNPSDIFSGTLSKETFTYKGKNGVQSEVANFFASNFTNGFAIRSTSLTTSEGTFKGSMQLAIRGFLVETEVEATLDTGKIKTLVIIDKSISPFPPTGAALLPATGAGFASTGDGGSLNYRVWGLVFALAAVAGLSGLVYTQRRSNSK